VDCFTSAADVVMGRPAPRGDAEQGVKPPCPNAPAISVHASRLLAAGFTQVAITATHQLAGGLHSAIIQAAKPAAPPGAMIRPMRADDADQVLAIYQAGLDTGDASFETTAPSWEAFHAAKLPAHRHVAIDATDGAVLGWIAASPVSARPVYAGVVEHSVYVLPAAHGRGIGEALLHALIDSTEAAGIWTIQSGIFPENTASIALHERLGFHTLGVRRRIGQHHGRWRDVIFIERRSSIVGIG
jgi:L-amino acid N-acyltransferase YncA